MPAKGKPFCICYLYLGGSGSRRKARGLAYQLLLVTIYLAAKLLWLMRAFFIVIIIVIIWWRLGEILTSSKLSIAANWMRAHSSCCNRWHSLISNRHCVHSTFVQLRCIALEVFISTTHAEDNQRTGHSRSGTCQTICLLLYRWYATQQY